MDTDIFGNFNLNAASLIKKYREMVPNEDKVVFSVEPLCCTMDMSADSEEEMVFEMGDRKEKLRVPYCSVSPGQMSHVLLSLTRLAKVFLNERIL